MINATSIWLIHTYMIVQLLMTSEMYFCISQMYYIHNNKLKKATLLLVMNRTKSTPRVLKLLVVGLGSNPEVLRLAREIQCRKFKKAWLMEKFPNKSNEIEKQPVTRDCFGWKNEWTEYTCIQVVRIVIKTWKPPKNDDYNTILQTSKY